MDYSAPGPGSPILTTDIVVVYFLAFLLILVAVDAVLHLFHRPKNLVHRVKIFLILALAIKLFLVGGGAVVAAFWFVPPPKVVYTSPSQLSENAPVNEKIEILFDRPVDRSDLEKKITPQVPGVWRFEDGAYKTHIFRKLVFYPDRTFESETDYTVTLSNIKNFSQISAPATYNLHFKTRKAPKVVSISPNNKKDVPPESEIIVNLSEPNQFSNEFRFEFEPPVAFNSILNENERQIVIKPKEKLKQGTSYTVKAFKTPIIYNLRDGKIELRRQTVEEAKAIFTTKEAPGVSEIVPSGNNVLINSEVKITFSREMDRLSVEKNLSFSPTIEGTKTWLDDKVLTFKPKILNYETKYTIKIAARTRAKDGGFLEKDILHEFTTIGTVKVINFNPSNGWTGVGLNNSLSVTFDQPADKSSAESKFSISPKIAGTFSWKDNTMYFKPSAGLSYQTTYTYSIASGVKSIYGLASNTSFSATFTTQQKETKLAVPFNFQKYALSCEVAALRMALRYGGFDVSEDTLLNQVGYDPTPHSGNIWGDPYAAFVGDVRGKQMTTGYGVYWDPIARVARNYTGAKSFTGWSLQDLTAEISKGNPVVAWGYSKGGSATYWYTPSGKKIYAVSGEHAFTVKGFVGPAENPSKIIVNDPLVGEVY